MKQAVEKAGAVVWDGLPPAKCTSSSSKTELHLVFRCFWKHLNVFRKIYAIVVARFGVTHATVEFINFECGAMKTAEDIKNKSKEMIFRLQALVNGGNGDKEECFSDMEDVKEVPGVVCDRKMRSGRTMAEAAKETSIEMEDDYFDDNDEGNSPCVLPHGLLARKLKVEAKKKRRWKCKRKKCFDQ